MQERVDVPRLRRQSRQLVQRAAAARLGGNYFSSYSALVKHRLWRLTGSPSRASLSSESGSRAPRASRAIFGLFLLLFHRRRRRRALLGQILSSVAASTLSIGFSNCFSGSTGLGRRLLGAGLLQASASRPA